jgi:hypothetical protein
MSPQPDGAQTPASFSLQVFLGGEAELARPFSVTADSLAAIRETRLVAL